MTRLKKLAHSLFQFVNAGFYDKQFSNRESEAPVLSTLIFLVLLDQPAVTDLAHDEREVPGIIFVGRSAFGIGEVDDAEKSTLAVQGLVISLNSTFN